MMSRLLRLLPLTATPALGYDSLKSRAKWGQNETHLFVTIGDCGAVGEIGDDARGWGCVTGLRTTGRGTRTGHASGTRNRLGVCVCITIRDTAERERELAVARSTNNTCYIRSRHNAAWRGVWYVQYGVMS